MKLSKAHILTVVGKALQQGITPQKLAMTCALGVVIGIFPIVGTTTLLCLVLAAWLRLNIPIMQLINYLVTAVQFVLIYPFIKAGIHLFNLPPFDYTKEQLIDMFQNNFWTLLKTSGLAVASGIAVWALVALPLFFVIYYGCFFLFTKWNKNGPSTATVS